jgi:hypothetical protein
MKLSLYIERKRGLGREQMTGTDYPQALESVWRKAKMNHFLPKSFPFYFVMLYQLQSLVMSEVRIIMND